MPAKESILVVDDDKAFRVATTALLRGSGYTVKAVPTANEALDLLKTEQFDLVLSDLVMEGMDGLQFLQNLQANHPDTLTVMITGYGSIESAVEAMKMGAFDYLTKPCNNEELRIKINRAIEFKRNKLALHSLREEISKLYTFGTLTSRNTKMREIFDLARKVAETDVTVLIRGETGTGKELLARAIHYNSSRRDKLFVTVNCSAIPDQLFESELFGHERGAFTGAHKQRKGKPEEADGGTLFLDEIGYIPVNVQTKLLRFLHDKTFERVGGNESLSADTRIIAATNQPLEQMIANGQFREDLFYRLNIFPITIPPLRERIEDIPLLAEHFLKKYSPQFGKQIPKISQSVITTMMNYSWKGNVRELENLTKRAIIKTEGDCITSIDLMHSNVHPENESPPHIDQAIELQIPFKEYIKQISADAEIKYLVMALKKYNGNVNRVAQMMGLDRKTIYRKLDEFSIDINQFRT